MWIYLGGGVIKVVSGCINVLYTCIDVLMLTFFFGIQSRFMYEGGAFPMVPLKPVNL
jgi:hypothetical protein